MMGLKTKFEQIVEGINIIAKHNKDDPYSFQPGHDQIWVGSYDLPLSDAEKEEMDQLGWFEDEESWSCFT